MRFFIIAAAVTLAFSELALDRVAATPHDPAGASAGPVIDPLTSGSAPLSASSPLPVGSPPKDAASSPDSEVTPGSPEDAAPVDSHPEGLAPEVHDVHAPPSPPSAPAHATEAVSAPHPAMGGATPLPGFVPGDMSSGKCMCPPPPSCAAGPPLSLSSGSNGTSNIVSSPPGIASAATNQTGAMAPPAPSVEGDTSSAAVKIFGQGGPIAGILAVAIIALSS